MEGCRKIWYI